MVDLSTKVRTSFQLSVARDRTQATSPTTPTSSSKAPHSSNRARVRASVPCDEEESKSENVVIVKNAQKASSASTVIL